MCCEVGWESGPCGEGDGVAEDEAGEVGKIGGERSGVAQRERGGRRGQRGSNGRRTQRRDDRCVDSVINRGHRWTRPRPHKGALRGKGRAGGGQWDGDGDDGSRRWSAREREERAEEEEKEMDVRAASLSLTPHLWKARDASVHSCSGNEGRSSAPEAL